MNLHKWIDKHPNLSTLIGLVLMILIAYLIVWVFKIGWTTAPPFIKEVAENVEVGI